MLLTPPTRAAASLFLDDAEDFFLAHNQKLLAVFLDLGDGVLAEQNAVASLDVQRKDLAFVVGLALANSNDFAFLGFLLGAIRDDDSTTNGSSPSSTRRTRMRSWSGVKVVFTVVVAIFASPSRAGGVEPRPRVLGGF